MDDINSGDIKQEQKDWINRIHDYRKEASSQFNTQLVYLSGGGLVLTIGFAKEIVNIKMASNTWLLIVCWLLFTSSLLLNLLSHKSTVKSMDFELDLKGEESNHQDNITCRYDQGSLFSLFIGIILFIIFISINL